MIPQPTVCYVKPSTQANARVHRLVPTGDGEVVRTACGLEVELHDPRGHQRKVYKQTLGLLMAHGVTPGGAVKSWVFLFAPPPGLRPCGRCARVPA